MAILDCHPDAEANFERRASDLLVRLAACPPQPHPEPGDYAKPDLDLPSIPTIAAESIIGPIRTGRVDYLGKSSAKYFVSGDQEIGLAGEDYRQFQLLAESIQRMPAWQCAVSAETVEEWTLDWLHARFEKRYQSALMPYLREAIRPSIRHYHAWVPLAHTSVAHACMIGRVVMKPIGASDIDRWHQSISVAREEDRAHLAEYVWKLRTQLASLAAATIEIDAEPDRAMDIALQEAEQTASILRLFSPLMTEPELISSCVPLGMELQPTSICLLFDGSQLSKSRSQLVHGMPQRTNVDELRLGPLTSVGFRVLNEVLTRDDKTPFQLRLLSALDLYSRSSLERDYGSRLVYVLAALESILLRNDTESIGQNVGERLAFLVSNNATERQEIAKTVRDIYRDRSRFLHHGAAIQDVERLRAFLQLAWRFFLSLVANANVFHDHGQLVDYVEKKKFE